MIVRELIELLLLFPSDAELAKVNLLDDTGASDTEMVKEDWGIAEIKDADGNKNNKMLVWCSFGEI